MTTSTVLVERDGPRATVTLNRPESRNGITNRMMRELHEALLDVAADPDLLVVVLTGAGSSFCVGADLKAYSSGELDERLDPATFDLTRLLHEMAPVTVAAINGAAAGAGFGWACACDLRVATRSAVFTSAFLKVAVAGDMAGPWSLPRLVGAAKARELYFLPERFDAEEALRIGLVSRVFDDTSFHDEVGALVAQLAASAPLALRGMKANFVAAERTTLADYITIETERHTRISGSQDTMEAFKAFVEKREARFQGR
jgi:2-(1,2-epoxy-1,2-dihydrophenyl)acetyl-CoA isomerase